MGLVRSVGPHHRLSRLFTDGSTTQGLRTKFADTLYPYLAAYSVGFWLYRTGTPAAERIICGNANFGTGGIGWAIRLETSNVVRIQEVYTSTDKRIQTTAATPASAWTYILCRSSSQASAAASSLDFVVDGAVDAGGTPIAGVGTHNASVVAQLLAVGTSPTSTLLAAGPFAIADLAIWDHKVHDQQGRDLFLGASPLDFRKGLVCYSPLDGEEGFGIEPELSGFGQPLFAFSSAAPAWWIGPPRVGRRPPLRRVTYRSSAFNTYTVTGSGGLTIGGSAAKSLKKAIAASGGLVIAGAAPVDLKKVIAASGGLTIGGAAAAALRHAIVAAGGIVIGGVAPITLAKRVTSSGGLSIGGVAPVDVLRRMLASGGMAIGGSAPVDRLYRLVASGGVVIGGAATVVRQGTHVVVGSGGLVVGGSAPVARKWQRAGAGGLAIAGTAAASMRRLIVGTGGLAIAGVSPVQRRVAYVPAGGLLIAGVASTHFVFGGTVPAAFIGRVLIVPAYGGRLAVVPELGGRVSIDPE